MSVQKYCVPLVSFFLFFNVLTAQADAPPSVLKNIEENKIVPKTKDLVRSEKASETDNKIYLNNLTSVQVDNPLFKNAIEAYWQPYLNKPVTNQDIASFKEWAWAEFKKSGYFAFLTLDVSRGGKLVVSVTVPKVHAIKVLLASKTIDVRYEDILAKRIAKKVKVDAPVDIFTIEQQLNELGFDFPLSLELNIRPISSDKVDLVVSVNEIENKPLHLSNGLVQYNNYGLKEYGRSQALASISLNGLTQSSIASITTQISEGIKYGRLDYEVPSEILRGHLRAYLSDVYSRNTLGGVSASESFTHEFGLGTTHILNAYRDIVFTSYLDLSKRNTHSNLISTGATINQIEDKQFKLKFTADNEKQKVDSSQHYEATFLVGDDDQKGHYSKIELMGLIDQQIMTDGWSLLTKAKAQVMPSRNLDVYNRISLGGVNGLRAFSTADGVGDQGMLVSLDLRKTLFDNQYVGIFYDGGLVKQNKYDVVGTYNRAYTMQDVGMQLGGSINNKIYYTTSVAKAIGSYDAYTSTNINSSPHNWRGYVSISFPF